MTTSNNANVNNTNTNEAVIEEQSFYQRHEGKIKIALVVCTVIGTGLFAWNKLKPSSSTDEDTDSTTETSETTETTNEADLQEIA